MWSRKRPTAAEPDAARLARMSSHELHQLLTGAPDVAARWVRVAAEGGVTEAQVRLGRMLLEGTGVPKDEPAAIRWFKTAARAHDADAMNMLGRCYENGWGSPVNMAQARDWYGKSAAAGNDWGQYNYGHLFLDGNGVERDTAAAYGWYLKAALQGHARAQNLVARCCEEGWGTAKDPAAAFDWYRRSAEGGYFRAYYNYATALTQRGRIDVAATWFWRAAEEGTPELRQAIATSLLGSRVPVLVAVGERVLALAA